MVEEREITYVELAKRLKNHGFKETEASITNKLKRRTFAATFMLACIAAMEFRGRYPLRTVRSAALQPPWGEGECCFVSSCRGLYSLE
jgi:hypothetical protein